MKKLLILGLFCACLLLLANIHSVLAYDYGYLRLTDVAGTCSSSGNKVIVQVYNEAQSSTVTADSIALTVYNRSSGAVVFNSSTTNATTFSSSCISSSVSAINVTVSITALGVQIDHNNITYNLASTSGGDDFTARFLVSTTKSEYAVTPSNDQVISNPNITRKVHVRTHASSSNGDIDYLEDHGIDKYNSGTGLWTNVVAGTKYGSDGTTANLALDGSGNLTAGSTVNIPSPRNDGDLFRWWYELLDQETPNLLGIYGAADSKYWYAQTYPYFYLGGDMRVNSISTAGTLVVGNPLTISAVMYNGSGYVTARASTSRIRIYNHVGTLQATKTASTGSLAPGDTETDSYSTFTVSVAGDFTIEACADYADVVTEIDDTNNCTSTVITVLSKADATPSTFELREVNGGVRTSFATGEAIYAYVYVDNDGDTGIPSGMVSQIYKNKPSTVTTGTVSDVPSMYITHQSFAGEQAHSYGSYPSGNALANYSTTKSWTQATAGSYTARVFLDYNDAVDESDETNNQATVTYTVGPAAPTLKPTTSLTCTSATVNWNASSGAGSYKVIYSPTNGTPASGSTSNTTSMSLTGLDQSTTYTFNLLPYTGSSGAGYAGAISADGTFTTPTCAPVAPTSPTVTSLTCSSVTLGWTAGAYATDYELTYTPSGGSATVTNVGNVVSKNLTGLTENKAYTWSIRSHNGAGYSSSLAGTGFTTLTCLHFNLTLPSGTTITPGTAAHPVVSITYLPSNALWTTQSGQITVGIVAFATGNNSCASYSNPSSFNNTPPASSNLTAKMSNGLSSISVSAPTSPTIDIVAASTATSATYTLCVGASSSQSADTQISPLVFATQRSAWVQIGGNSPGATFGGDVHSNASISNIILPSVPVQQYFYSSPSAGVVSSTGAISVASNQVSQVVSTNWLWSSYRQVTTPTYSEIYTNSPALANNLITTATPSDTQVASACALATTKVYSVTGNVTIASGHPIAFSSPSCNNADLIYFVSGNLTVNANITDSSATGSITFVVDGDITLSSTVTTLDGMYVFSGSFSDGIGSSALTIHGSLIGLSGSTPGAATGTFSPGGTSGFQRDLGSNNDTQPAESVFFQPKYLYRIKDYLGTSTFTWTE